MKLVKSLLLGSAAGIAAVAGAQAADLPSRKAAPVEYVRVCSAYGAGFFYIPGTDTCLRVGGRIRAEYLVQETFNAPGLDTQDNYGFRARGRLNVDARTATAYGTLRTFIRFEMTVSNGSYGQGVNSTGPQFTNARGGAGGTVSNLDKGFIQFGGLTAGRAQSFFDFYADSINYGPVRGSDMTSNLLAYTATFGSGFSATLSLEDRSEREVTPIGFTAGGQVFPDLVGVLNVTQGWGSAQLSGAVFQRNSQGVLGVAGSKDEVGFAIQGGVKINLPMLAAGDELWLQAAYTEGGLSYLGYGGNGTGSTWGANTNVGRLAFTNTDVSVDAYGSAKLTKGWAVTAAFLHYWTPTIRQGIYGSYSELDYASNLSGAGTFLANQDPKEWRVGTNVIWSPVAGLDIGVEVLYAHAEVKNRIQAAGRPLGLLVKSDDSLQGRLRIQRDF